MHALTVSNKWLPPSNKYHAFMLGKQWKRKKLSVKYRRESDPGEQEKRLLQRSACLVPTQHHRLRIEMIDVLSSHSLQRAGVTTDMI